MDREDILRSSPNNDEFGAAPNHRKKEIVEQIVSDTLDALDKETREPDPWEAQDIASALGLLLLDWYSAASAAAIKALTPSSERADPASWTRVDGTPTTQELRDALEYVKGKPARRD